MKDARREEWNVRSEGRINKTVKEEGL